MNIVVAVDENGGIGYQGDLLVSIPLDHQRFRKQTINKVVVMGRKTLESLPQGQPLGQRDNIILSADPAYNCRHAEVAHSMDEALKLLEKYLNDARANLEELKSETSAIIADEMAAARRVNANSEEIAKYDRYAEQAVLAGNDDDARKFLDAKSQLTAKKADLENAYQLAKDNSDKMRQMTRKLMDDIASAEGKMVELRAKLSVAEHKEKMDDLMHKVSGRTDMSGFENMMEAVQKRIDSVDAKVALNEELADKMDIKKLEEKYSEKAAEVSATVEADLAALKARLGK